MTDEIKDEVKQDSGLVRMVMLRAYFTYDKENPDNGKRVDEGTEIDVPTDEAFRMIETGLAERVKA